MRTSLTLSLTLLALVVACGVVSAQLTGGVSDRYVSAAEELTVLTGEENWQRAEETASAYLTDWMKTEKWLQILAEHEDTDDVTMALKRIAAGIRAKDVSMCLEACGELREHALHIDHRDAFTWGNVL